MSMPPDPLAHPSSQWPYQSTIAGSGPAIWLYDMELSPYSSIHTQWIRSSRKMANLVFQSSSYSSQVWQSGQLATPAAVISLWKFQNPQFWWSGWTAEWSPPCCYWKHSQVHRSKLLNSGYEVVLNTLTGQTSSSRRKLNISLHCSLCPHCPSPRNTL